MTNFATHHVVQRTFAGDERYELAHALLHAFLCFLCYFCILGQGSLHNSGHYGKLERKEDHMLGKLNVIDKREGGRAWVI